MVPSVPQILRNWLAAGMRAPNQNKTAFKEIFDQDPLQACLPLRIVPPSAGAITFPLAVSYALVICITIL